MCVYIMIFCACRMSLLLVITTCSPWRISWNGLALHDLDLFLCPTLVLEILVYHDMYFFEGIQPYEAAIYLIYLLSISCQFDHSYLGPLLNSSWFLSQIYVTFTCSSCAGTFLSRTWIYKHLFLCKVSEIENRLINWV